MNSQRSETYLRGFAVSSSGIGKGIGQFVKDPPWSHHGKYSFYINLRIDIGLNPIDFDQRGELDEELRKVGIRLTHDPKFPGSISVDRCTWAESGKFRTSQLMFDLDLVEEPEDLPTPQELEDRVRAAMTKVFGITRWPRKWSERRKK